MEDLAAPAPAAPLTWRQRLLSPRTLASIAAGFVVGAAITGGIWRFHTKPRVDAARKIYDATMDMWALYDLQMAAKRNSGAFVDGLDALLATTKDGPALKARMAGRVDLNTAAVVGDAEKFKIELNILNRDRTLLRIRGPIGRYLWARKTAAPPPETSASSGDMGAPIAR
ncbi:MAG: hypothetical protein A2V88_16050 [Elusimicrobia bacterium RBG_16_66_12]|nr:MAG: hypothetical protein A2V88_16050 [Elusimicrobia bacterium RBG_16_66_12]